MNRILFGIIGAGLVGFILSSEPIQAQRKSGPDDARIDQLQRVFSLSVVSSNPTRLLLATPLGLFEGTPDGKAKRVGGLTDVVMGLTVHPKNSKHMLVGGHPGKSGSIGVLASDNGGKKWKQISKDGAGHVGFHIMEISRADPRVVYGLTSAIRVSKDGGKTWREVAAAPEGLIHLATSSVDSKTLYAATRQGLLVSYNQGAKWEPTGLPGKMATMVTTTNTGQVYAFGTGAGLSVATEKKLHWKNLSNNFQDRILLRMVVDPTNSKRLFAATVTGAVVISQDGGKSWIAFEGSHNAKPETIAKGSKLFATYCQACHGPSAKGQRNTPNFDSKNPPKIMAPALDDSDHGWHHGDADLVNTILNGSPREGSPMIAWKGQLSRKDAESLVAYIKSLWSFRSIACQGARHMACMQHQ